MTTDTTRRQRVRSSWSALFGVVPDKGLQRRPTEILRIVVGLLLLAFGALRASTISPVEQSVHNLVLALPDGIVTALRWLNTTGALVAIIVVAIAALVSRRPRFIGVVALAAGLTYGLGRVLNGLVGIPHDASGPIAGFPHFPNLRLAVVAAVFYAAGPELTRPARRLMLILLCVIAASLASVTGGYPTGIIGALGLAWMVAAIVHLLLGSPDGAPASTMRPGS
jgi:hypothetical protein